MIYTHYVDWLNMKLYIRNELLSAAVEIGKELVMLSKEPFSE